MIIKSDIIKKAYRSVFGAIALSLISNAAFAGAQLMVDPTRIELNEKDRSADITIINNGDQTGTYRIDMFDMVMDPIRGLAELTTETPNPYSAKDLLRLSPRSVTLTPGTSQKARLLVRKPKDLPDGEYRTHLRVKSHHQTTAPEPTTGDGGFNVTMVPKFNLIIPVIIRQGETYVQASFQDIVPTKDPKTGELKDVHVIIKRDGNRSVTGIVDVTYIPTSGSPIKIAEIVGATIYREAPYRDIKAPLVPDLPDGFKLGAGTLKATFTQLNTTNKGRKVIEGDVIAEAELPIK